MLQECSKHRVLIYTQETNYNVQRVWDSWLCQLRWGSRVTTILYNLIFKSLSTTDCLLTILNRARWGMERSRSWWYEHPLSPSPGFYLRWWGRISNIVPYVILISNLFRVQQLFSFSVFFESLYELDTFTRLYVCTCWNISKLVKYNRA